MSEVERTKRKRTIKFICLCMWMPSKKMFYFSISQTHTNINPYRRVSVYGTKMKEETTTKATCTQTVAMAV